MNLIVNLNQVHGQSFRIYCVCFKETARVSKRVKEKEKDRMKRGRRKKGIKKEKGGEQ